MHSGSRYFRWIYYLGAVCLTGTFFSMLRLHAEGAASKPHRLVSINLCVDEIVLRVADRRNVASITWLSRHRDVSNVVDIAQTIPINHGLAEEVVAFHPDLVLAGLYTTRPTVSVLSRIGIRTMDIDMPRSFDEIRKQYREVARILGEQENGEHVISEMDRRLFNVAGGPSSMGQRAMILIRTGTRWGVGLSMMKSSRGRGLSMWRPALATVNMNRSRLKLLSEILLISSP